MLYAIIPSPIRDHAQIRFDLPASGKVRLAIYDPRGRLIRTAIADEPMNAGPQQWLWNARNDSGDRVPAGVYLYVLEAGDQKAARKSVVIQ
jgi:flagellar hook assembly protein FlgD